jgi:hypothetical protein
MLLRDCFCALVCLRHVLCYVCGAFGVFFIILVRFNMIDRKKILASVAISSLCLGSFEGAEASYRFPTVNIVKKQSKVTVTQVPPATTSSITDGKDIKEKKNKYLSEKILSAYQEQKVPSQSSGGVGISDVISGNSGENKKEESNNDGSGLAKSKYLSAAVVSSYYEKKDGKEGISNKPHEKQPDSNTNKEPIKNDEGVKDEEANNGVNIENEDDFAGDQDLARLQRELNELENAKADNS